MSGLSEVVWAVLFADDAGIESLSQPRPAKIEDGRRRSMCGVRPRRNGEGDSNHAHVLHERGGGCGHLEAAGPMY